MLSLRLKTKRRVLRDQVTHLVSFFLKLLTPFRFTYI